MNKQGIVALDLEGVLVPEIWIAFALQTGIEKLKLTTRDIPDYNELMQGRLELLNANGLTLSAIQEVIGTLSPLEGARNFLDALRSFTQVIRRLFGNAQSSICLQPKVRKGTKTR